MPTNGSVDFSTRTEPSGGRDKREERCCGARSCACAEERTARDALVEPRKNSRPAALCALTEETASVLLLALGNPLMSDDGAGQALLARLESEATAWGSRVEFMDGGTQGLALLGKFEGRKAVVFLDAVRLGDRAGAVHLLRGDELARMGGARAATAHEGSAPQILAALQLLGEVPEDVSMVGIEPEQIRTGMGLSAPVEASLGCAAQLAGKTIETILEAMK